MKTILLKTHRNTKIQNILLDRFIKSNPGVEIEFEAEPEDMSISDSFSDERDVKYIIRQLERGNDYAWFCAKVTVKYKGYEATDYLGGCSYESEKDFKEHSGYYIDMIQQCIDQINNDVTGHNNAVCKAFKTRQLKQMAESLGFIVIPKTAIV